MAYLNIYLLASSFSILSIVGYSQKMDTVFMNKVLQPKFSFDKNMDEQLKNTLNGINFPELNAGDYIDGDTKFTVAIATNIFTNGEVKQGYYEFFIAPYRADSIYIGRGVHETAIRVETPIVAQVGDNEYRMEISKYGKYILISKIDGKYINPDVKLFTNLLPDLSFSLIDGGESSFSHYEHRNKYIYIEFWGTWCGGCMQSLKTLKEINELYHDRLIIISLDYMDTDNESVKKVVQENNLDWIQGITDESINRELLQNGVPYGILCDSEGNIIRRELLPAKLKHVLQNMK